MKVRQAVGIAAIIAAVLIVGMCDRQAVDAERNQYCEMVKMGAWPDYRQTYKAECGGEEPPKFNEDLTK